MPDTMQHDPYVVEFHGLKVECKNVAQVVEAVRALVPLEREVPVPRWDNAPQPQPQPQPITIIEGSPVATAVYDLFRAEPSWRRPVEIVKALKRRRVPGAKYTSVYAVLRYGDFVKREGRWNVKDAPATL